MKKIQRAGVKGLAVATASIMAVSPVFAAGWQHNNTGWWYGTNSDNTAWHSNGWQWVDGNGDGTAECYYFGPDGYMYAGKTTPDGYTVNADGAWVNNGAVQTKSVAAGSAGLAVSNEQNGQWQRGTGVNASGWQWKNSDGSIRKGGWYWLDGNRDGVAECYYLDGEGWMLSDCRTPDGYTVNAGGAWVEGNTVRTKNLNTGMSGLSGSAVIGGGSSSGGGGGASGGGSSSGSSLSTGTSVIRMTDEEIENYMQQLTEDRWKDYNDSSVSHAVNDFNNGNRSLMSADEWSDTKERIETFKSEQLTGSMSDFEKEIKIVKWIAANCKYDKTSGAWSELASAYSCIVEGKALCAGYADAFLQTAKLCGLDVRYIYNDTHAWNLVKLDGEWYHVDVTWEDSGSDICNKYLNLEDEQIKNILHHKDWKPTSIKANGIKYGPSVVAKYLKDGTIDTSLGISYKEKMNQFFDKISSSSGSLSVQYTSNADAASKITNYVSERIDNRQSNVKILIRFGSTLNTGKSGDFSKATKLRDSIMSEAEAAINNKYGSVLTTQFKPYLSVNGASGGEYYAYGQASLNYKAGSRLQVPYVIHFMCNGTEVGTQSGNAEQSAKMTLNVPDGYSAKYDGCKVLSGSGNINVKSFTITGRDQFEANVELTDKSIVSYTIRYVDAQYKELDKVSGTGEIGSEITPENKTFEGYELYNTDELKPHTLNERSSLNTITLRYQKVGTWTINYVCKNNNEVLATETGTAQKGTRVIIPSKTFEGYTLDTQTRNFTTTGGNDTFTVKYSLAKTQD